MGFMDKLKQKAEEYDLQGKADKLAEQIEKGTQQAVEKAGELAHDNRDKIATGIDKAGATFDERTQGKYADKVAKAKDLAAKGVDKVAEQRHAGTDERRGDGHDGHRGHDGVRRLGPGAAGRHPAGRRPPDDPDDAPDPGVRDDADPVGRRDPAPRPGRPVDLTRPGLRPPAAAPAARRPCRRPAGACRPGSP